MSVSGPVSYVCVGIHEVRICFVLSCMRDPRTCSMRAPLKVRA